MYTQKTLPSFSRDTGLHVKDETRKTDDKRKEVEEKYNNKLTSLYLSIQKCTRPPDGIPVDEDVRPSEGEKPLEEGPLPEGVEPEKTKIIKFTKLNIQIIILPYDPTPSGIPVNDLDFTGPHPIPSEEVRDRLQRPLSVLVVIAAVLGPVLLALDEKARLEPVAALVLLFTEQM